ncbi:hypothetical protein HYDPIDRAFT_40937, partial [Hydnomerulius pinastri MD-312]
MPLFNLWSSSSSAPTVSQRPLAPRLTPPPHHQDWQDIPSPEAQVPQSPASTEDDIGFERLGDSQVDGAREVRRLERTLAQTQEHNIKLENQLSGALEAQKKLEEERDGLEAKVNELRRRSRGEKDRLKKGGVDAIPGSFPPADSSLKEENERLKAQLQQETQKTNLVLDEIKRERSQLRADREALRKGINEADS